MNTVTHPGFAGATKLVVTAKRLLLRAVHAVMEARMRRIQYEIELHRGFHAYREGKGNPPLNEDLRSGS